MDWYNKTADDVLREQNTDAAMGLVPANARHRLERYGGNTLPAGRPQPLWARILRQCRDASVVIALLGTVFAAAAGAYAAAVLFFLAAAARVGLEAARKAPEGAAEGPAPLGRDAKARVLRSGRAEQLAAAELVPGDIVLIEEGDIIPADLRLVSSSNLQMDESALTGAPGTAYKDAEAVFNGPAELSERVNMAYMGSVAVGGRGLGVVVATGEKSELGRVAAGAHVLAAEEGPLAGRLRVLGLGLGALCAAGWLLILVLSLARGQGPEIPGRLADFAAALLPASLPVAALLVLDLGLRRMKARGAVLRRPAAAGRLGEVNVLCVDKTGTLTQNCMSAAMLWSAGRATTVEGAGNLGSFKDSDGRDVDVLSRRDLILAFTAAALCNNASLKESAVDTWTAVGDPTEGALLQLAFQAGLQKDALDEAFPRLAEIPFDARRRMMTTIHRGYKRPIGYTKGAPDVVLARCAEFERGGRRTPMTPQLRRRILDINRLMAAQSLRVLALAYREYTAIASDAAPESLEEELIFVGLVGLTDPLRPDSREAVAACRAAGIRPVLVTGDARDTAAALARAVGLVEEGEAVLTGAELDLLSDAALRGAVKNTRVFARVTPRHKLRILEALQKNGDTVAFVGDGVSDVPALRRADVGVGKGKSGTQIARSAAGLELSDDGFATLVAAVEEGRILAENTRKLTRFLLAANAAAAIVLLAAAVAGFAPPFGALPLLSLHLLLTLLPALALGTERREKGRHAGREAARPPVNGSLLLAAGVQGLFTAVAVLVLFFAARDLAPAGEDAGAYGGGMAYALLLVATLLAGFSCRRESAPFWQRAAGAGRYALAALIPLLAFAGALALAPLRGALGFAALSVTDWLIVLGCGLLLTALTEAYKLFLQPLLESRFPALQKGPKPGRAARRLPGKASRTGRIKERLRGVPLSFSGSDPTLEDEAERESDDTVDPEELPRPLTQEREAPAGAMPVAAPDAESDDDTGSDDGGEQEISEMQDISTGEDDIEPLPPVVEARPPIQPLRPLDTEDFSALVEEGADDADGLENVNNAEDLPDEPPTAEEAADERDGE